MDLGDRRDARRKRWAQGEQSPRRPKHITDRLDTLQVYSKNQSKDPNAPALAKGERPILPMETVLALVTDAFTGATERHIEVGDGLQIWTIVKGEGATLRELRECLTRVRAELSECAYDSATTTQLSRGIRATVLVVYHQRIEQQFANQHFSASPEWVREQT